MARIIKSDIVRWLRVVAHEFDRLLCKGLRFSVSCCCALLLVWSTAYARVPTKLERTEWARLLRLEHKRDAWTSDVDPGSFHLAGEPLDPERELQAFLAAITQAQQTSPTADQDPRCRFPARTAWVRRVLGVVESNRPRCAMLTSWLAKLSPPRISVIFAAQYAGNPASFMGHTFLKLRQRTAINRGTVPDLLDATIGFLAMIPSDTTALMYIAGGLGGGFHARFVAQDFDHQAFEYQAIEDRDLWEYPLQLSASQLEMLLLHYWELSREASFHYRFLSGNCASMLAQMILAVRPELDAPWGWNLYVTPHQVIHWLADHQLTSVPTSWASARAQTLMRLAHLNASERRQIDEDLAMSQPSADQRYAYYDALLAGIDYAELKRGEALDAKAEALRAATLRMLAAQAPPAQAFEEPKAATVDPSLGHAPAMALLGGGRDQESGFVDLELRPAAHALIDPPQGFRRDLGFEVLDLRGRLRADGKALLTGVDLLRLVSVAPYVAPAAKPAWRLRFGYYNDDRPRYSVGYAGAAGGIGLATQAGDASRAWLMANLELRALAGNIALSPAVECGALLWMVGDHLRFETTLTASFPYDLGHGPEPRRTEVEVRAAALVSPNIDLRLDVRLESVDQHEFRFALAHFL